MNEVVLGFGKLFLDLPEALLGKPRFGRCGRKLLLKLTEIGLGLRELGGEAVPRLLDDPRFLLLGLEIFRGGFELALPLGGESSRWNASARPPKLSAKRSIGRISPPR